MVVHTVVGEELVGEHNSDDSSKLAVAQLASDGGQHVEADVPLEVVHDVDRSANEAVGSPGVLVEVADDLEVLYMVPDYVDDLVAHYNLVEVLVDVQIVAAVVVDAGMAQIDKRLCLQAHHLLEDLPHVHVETEEADRSCTAVVADDSKAEVEEGESCTGDCQPCLLIVVPV